MDLLEKIPRTRLPLTRAVIAPALLSGALVAFAVFTTLQDRASHLARSLTSINCRVASIRPCFPCGIKASGITLCSKSGAPFFEAKEVGTQVNVLRYLQAPGKAPSLFDTLHADQVKLVLARNERGEWDLPQLSTLQGIRGSAHGSRASPHRFLFTNVTIVVKTAAGASERFYNTLEADVDPEKHSVSLILSGHNESMRMTLRKGAVKQYELRADNFSMALLAPVSAFPLPLGNLFLNGNVTATTRDDTYFAIEGNGTMAAQDLRSRVIASGTVDGFNLPFYVTGTVTSSGVENLAAKISLAGESVIVRGDIRGWEKPVIDLTSDFFNFSYDRAISALPTSLHPSLPVIRVSGSMTGTFSFHLDMADPGSLEYRYNGRTDRLEVLDLGHDIDMNRLKGPFLHKVRMNPEKETWILLSPDNPDFTPYGKIPFSLRSAVLAAEDLGFFSHRGFSKRHIRGSLIENLKAGKVVRGASTISMQLAKNLFLSSERTLSRKLEEALITLALEQNLDKKRIMEIYLNIIEWGDGIYGIGQASHYYFGKRPRELSPLESAFLASIIARPKNWFPDPLSRLRPGWLKYLQVILCKMYQMGAADIEDLLKAGVPEARILALLPEETAPSLIPAFSPYTSYKSLLEPLSFAAGP